MKKTLRHAVLILIAFLGAIIPAWSYGQITWINPFILGIIAAALTEQNDNLPGRVKAIGLTLLCFLIATLSVELLFDYPWLFACGIAISTFGFIMLGAISSRYATIAFGSLLIAVYTMIGTSAAQSTSFWLQPALLLTGACWYYLLSLIWLILFPSQSIQQSLSDVFLNLADYFDLKSEMFHPVSGLQIQPYRIREANLNTAIVLTLNQCKATLLAHCRKGHLQTTSDHFLNIYFLAQDIHERISSTHSRYHDLTDHFSRSDILFRFKYLLAEQAKACRDIARVITANENYQHQKSSALALDELQSSIQYLNHQAKTIPDTLITQINYLFNNLTTIEKQLCNIDSPDAHQFMEGELSDTDPRTLRNMWQRVRTSLNPESLLFRHAVRMSLALTTGYMILHSFHLALGYWILLTTLFVCQPNFSATRKRIKLRVIGTISGLIAGGVLMPLFSSYETQLAFIVFSGVMFFIFRLNKYGYATGFITMLVLFCFNQSGTGMEIILPRLTDTLIGCGLAVIAVTYILPDWQANRLPQVMAEAMQTNKNYLDQIIAQYRIGKQDTLRYRIARRNAHDQDAALTTAINNMLAEPDKYKKAEEESFRFLTLNHALLSYISALGAHRTRLDNHVTHRLIVDAHRTIHQHLDVLSEKLLGHHRSAEISIPEETELKARLEAWREEDGSSVKLVLQQLDLIHRILPELHILTDKLLAPSG
ncbi:Inner membrane protein YccS [Vibrio aerogenes CECT 7868]|uniref:Inner membrane protein YccS n=1 Tax=Vibrio aerogenes CECT 7868 TaxID=1216006 RepID=A0A1M5ZUW7_9VIBR|nr:YccS family putative transporter [Vibrio aerogenes]SHI28035.1 Inner membrane protein YccS [Vibrio aerogenes CECT 7868]